MDSEKLNLFLDKISENSKVKLEDILKFHSILSEKFDENDLEQNLLSFFIIATFLRRINDISKKRYNLKHIEFIDNILGKN